MVDQRVSKSIYYMKAIAILTVAIAHCTYSNPIMQRITDILGTIGVPIFLITGGIFFHNDVTFKDFAFHKIKRIVVPWIVWGTITFVLHILSDRSGFSFLNYFNWLIGYKTWLYYVPVVLICYLVFYLSTNTIYVISLSLVSFVSYLLTLNGVIFIPCVTDCQNPLNWIMFFGFGILLSKIGIKTFIPKEKALNKLLVISAFVFILSCLFYYLLSQKKGFTPSYWNWYSLLFEITSCIFVYSVSLKLADRNDHHSIILEIGKNSYIIFFAHMQIGINLINIVFFNVWNHLPSIFAVPIVLLRGCLIIAVTYFIFVYLLKKIIQSIKAQNFSWIIGL